MVWEKRHVYVVSCSFNDLTEKGPLRCTFSCNNPFKSIFLIKGLSLFSFTRNHDSLRFVKLLLANAGKMCILEVISNFVFNTMMKC